MFSNEMEAELKEVYNEETAGRKYRVPIASKKRVLIDRKEPAGEVASVNFTKPMMWEEFLKLPSSLKEMYVKHLKDRYGMSAIQLADMFKVHYTTLNRELKSIGVKGVFGRGRVSQTTKQVREWREFVDIPGKEETTDISKNNTENCTDCRGDELSEVLTCSFKLRGFVNLEDIKNKIQTMTSPDTRYDIQISIRQSESNNGQGA